MQERSEFQINVSMTPEQATEFLSLLADDDETRERFETDTQALLAEWGIEVPGELVPEEVLAPSRGTLHDAIDQLGGPQVPPPYSPPPHSFWLVFIALSRASKR
jgi:hypothetical protein